MKTFKGIIRSNLGVSGIVISLISIVSIISILSVRDEAIKEFERIKIEEKCFQGEKPDPEWEKMTPEEKKEKSNKCMSALNKASQLKTGPYVFSLLLVIGIFLIVLSILKTAKEEKELMEEKEDKENDS
ncbi:MAG: hypothetical protein ACOX2F_00955 [bacterium]